MTHPLSSSAALVRAAAVEWVERVLAAQWPHEQQPAQLAEALVAIGEKYEVPDEGLLEWLHFHEPAPRAWKDVCERYAAAKALMAQREGFWQC